VAEVEIHAGHPHEGDELGKKVGVMVGVIGIVLAVVTIASHREHTAAVVLKTEANDQWAYYQAKKIREHESVVGGILLEALDTDAPRIKAGIDKLLADRDKYAREAGRSRRRRKRKSRRPAGRRRVPCVSTWVKGCWSWGWCCPPCTSCRESGFFLSRASSPRWPEPY
jgi:hypothetical protein